MRYIACLICTAAMMSAFARAGTNIDAGHRYSWAENAGWLSFCQPTDNEGVRVLPTILSGYAWSENVGWMCLGDGLPGSATAYANTDSADYGVNIDPITGDLFGLAWGENVGWVNFDTRAALKSLNQNARVDFVGRRLRGYAWGENIGWINLDSPVEFVGFTWPACSDPFADVDQDGDVDQVDFAQLQRCMSPAYTGIAEGCECFNRPELPALPRGDADVDLQDLDAFLFCAGGPAVPAMIDCDD